MGYNFPWPKCAEENLKQKQMINMGKTNIIRLGHLFYFFYIKVMITLFICSSRVLIILPLQFASGATEPFFGPIYEDLEVFFQVE